MNNSLLRDLINELAHACVDYASSKAYKRDNLNRLLVYAEDDEERTEIKIQLLQLEQCTSNIAIKLIKAEMLQRALDMDCNDASKIVADMLTAQAYSFDEILASC